MSPHRKSPGGPASTCCRSVAPRTGPVGEAVVFFRRDLARISVAGQAGGATGHKMRVISAQWMGLLDKDVWLSNARHANAMARAYDKVKGTTGIGVMFPSRKPTRCSWRVPPKVQERLRAKGWRSTHSSAKAVPLHVCLGYRAGNVDQLAADMTEAVAEVGGVARKQKIG